MHGHDDDHEHTDFGEEADHVLWRRDRLRYTSVGIDIGSATAQVVFADIEMRRLGREMSSRFVPVSQRVLYASPIVFTPYLDDDAGIDAERLASFVQQSYELAGQTPAGILAGVVLLTGNALLQRNARSLAETLAKIQGDFVCHGAGHDMEARISARGSGAMAISRERAATVLNIDIGGGTTKLAMVKDGAVIGTAAVGVGSRSVTFDETGAVRRVNDVAADTAEILGVDLSAGRRPTEMDLRRLAREMLAGVGDVIRGGTGRAPAPLLTSRFPLAAFDVVVVSGGVAEYLRGEPAGGHGDLGWYLAAALRELIDELGQLMEVAVAPIRATVLGSARDTIQLTGNTIYVSDHTLLPRRNVPVVPMPEITAGGGETIRRLASDLAARSPAIDQAGGVAFPLDWGTQPTQRQLLETLNAVVDAVSCLDHSAVVVLVIEQDLANAAGQITKNEIGLVNPLVCIDGITTDGLDYIDVARLDHATSTLQVTMKSLLFGAVQQ